MLFLIAVAIAVLFSWCCAEPLRKYPIPFYIAGTLLSAIILILNQMHIQFSAFVNTYVIGLFQKGILPAALWCVVAWIGAIPDELKEIRKKLIPSRGELSVFTALLTLSHAVIYSISYLQRLLNGRTDGNDFILTCLCCLALMLLTIPLTVMSFKTVRKKINGKTWKNLQKSAYLFYALIYLHIMIILIPKARSGREVLMLDIILYTIVFAGYAICRIRKAVIRKNKTQKMVLLNSACTFVFLLFTGTIGISSRAVNVPKAICIILIQPIR